MEIPIYQSLNEFRREYEFDFSGLKDISLLQYFKKLKEKYENHLKNIDQNESDEINKLFSRYKDFYKVYLPKITHLSYQFEDFLDREIDMQIDENDSLQFDFDPYYLFEHSALINNEENTILLKKYAEIYLQTVEIKNGFKLKKIPFKKILDFINDLIENERVFVLRGTPTAQQEEPEPLTAKQQQKVGLLIRSGILDLLREKNPRISNNQISSFIELLTAEPMKKTSINPHLVNSVDNPKHPFYLTKSLDEIDLILKKFGISPQAEN